MKLISLGGYPKFIQEGYNAKWLPVWLKDAGYQTYFTGKLMNAHTIENYHMKLSELSLDGHDFMLEPGSLYDASCFICQSPLTYHRNIPVHEHDISA